MALVDELAEVLPPRPAIDPRLLARALRPGRMQAVALPLVDEVRASPRGGSRRVSKGLRAARSLHSNERRLVGDLIWDLIRFEDLLERSTGSRDVLAHWLALLVWLGAEEADARESWHHDRPLELPDLSRVLREHLKTTADPAHQLAFAGSLDPALARALLDSFDPARCARILAASNERAPTTLRVNLRAVDRPRLQRILAEQGIETTPTRWSRAGLIVQGRANLVGTAAYRSGWFEVQDEASQLVTALVPRRARTIIDWCAGAGGKTLALAASHPRARIWSLDVRQSALDELERRARRAGVRVQTRLHSRRGSLPQADCVLVDAPCSGSGVLRRHPEHRRTLTAEALEELTTLQLAVLDEAAAHVAESGTLLYATCSLLAAENRRTVDAFLARHPSFEPVASPELDGLPGPDLELSPDLHGTDGFFAAALRRRA